MAKGRHITSFLLATLTASVGGELWRQLTNQFNQPRDYKQRSAPGFCTGATCRASSRRVIPPADLPDVEWPIFFPFVHNALHHEDVEDDEEFYEQPDHSHHFGNRSMMALSSFYADFLPSIGVVRQLVEIAAGWDSHLPSSYMPTSLVGMGMNKQELDKNHRLSQRIVQNLNTNPVLPFLDGSVDAFLTSEGAHYLTSPIEVFREMRRALKPGGVVVASFTNKQSTPKKVVKAWRKIGDLERCVMLMSYLKYSGFERYEAYEVDTGDEKDPLYVILGYSPKISLPATWTWERANGQISDAAPAQTASTSSKTLSSSVGASATGNTSGANGSSTGSSSPTHTGGSGGASHGGSGETFHGDL